MPFPPKLTQAEWQDIESEIRRWVQSDLYRLWQDYMLNHNTARSALFDDPRAGQSRTAPDELADLSYHLGVRRGNRYATIESFRDLAALAAQRGKSEDKQ